MIVGLTGSIGTGKSTISKMFADMGAHLIDYDILAREVVMPGQPAWQDIVDAFGREVLAPDNTLDRKKMGDMVFVDKQKLQQLNAIVHPRVFMADKQKTEAILQKDPTAIIIKEMPLLTQAGAEAKKLVDVVVVVSASLENQVKRVMSRGFTEEEAKVRIRAQVPVSETEKFGDYVIHNNGSFEEANEQVRNVYNILKRKNA